MKLRLTFYALALLALSIAVGSAADVSGKWVAQVPGRDGGTQEMTLNLKMDGGKLTGTVVTGQREQSITEGQVTGDSVSFVVVQSRGGTEMKTIYKGTVSGSEMKLTRTREGGRGGGAPVEFTAKRAGS